MNEGQLQADYSQQITLKYSHKAINCYKMLNILKKK